MMRVFMLMSLCLIAVASTGLAPQHHAEDAGVKARVLVFTKTAGYRHPSIADGLEAIRRLGTANGFAVEHTDDAGAFTRESLGQYDAVVFLSTTGDVLTDAQQGEFEAYMRAGGGYVGVHAASDCEYDWDWYGNLVGAYFNGHPRIQEATILVADDTHASTRHLPSAWVRTDEWYNFKVAPRAKPSAGEMQPDQPDHNLRQKEGEPGGHANRPYYTILLRLDESTYEGGTMGDDHPIAWCHEYGGGRAWYTGLGHTKESFVEPAFLQHLLGGIQWAARIEPSGESTRQDASDR